MIKSKYLVGMSTAAVALAMSALPFSTLAASGHDHGGVGAGQADMHTGDYDMSKTHYFTANLGQLNNSGTTGTAYVEVTGRQAKVQIKTQGASAGLPHAQHIHIGGQMMCPTPAADTDKDGYITVAEGAPFYGGIQVSLTTEGDTSADSGLAVDRFPLGGSDGSITYSRTITLPEGLDARDIADGVIVQHGSSKLFDDPAKYDGAKRSSIAPDLPLEATIPVDCGKLTMVQPVGGNGEGMTPMPQPSMTPMPTMSPMPTATPKPITDNAAMDAYYQAMRTATDTHVDRVMAARMNYDMTSAESRDRYVDAVNHANADFFNTLNMAKDKAAATWTGSGEAKDAFVGSVNRSFVTLGAEYEALKK